ncbi:hypothetical protein [Microbacterium deminutum]|uniref:Uncharacterized protein n=1 Tax=Microbacterium deminutum TaxID=344164 RepID=A0ABP5CMA7_9MICO
MAIDTVAMPPALEAYYRDVLTIAEAMLDDSDSYDALADALEAPTLDIEAVDFQITVPSGSIDGVNAALGIVRLAADAAYVALVAHENRDLLSVDAIEQLFLKQPNGLSFFDAGQGSFWGKIRRPIEDEELRDRAGPYIVLVGVALGVIASLTGVPVVLAVIVAAIPGIDAVWQLGVRAGGERRARLASVDPSKAEETTVAIVGDRPITARAPITGATRDVVGFLARLRSATVLVRTADVEPAEGEEDATLVLVASDRLSWADVRAIAEEFLVELGDPMIAVESG